MSTSVFVLKPSSFGDIIHTLPAVALIKDARRDWTINWLVNSEWAPLLAGNPTVDRVTLFPRREFRGITGVFRFWRWTKAEVSSLRPDLAVDFQGLLRTALIGRASRAKSSYGLSDAREGAARFYGHVADVSHGTLHAVERYLALSRLAVGTAGTVPSSLGHLLPGGVAPEGADALLDKPYVLLHPFSRGRDKSLGWGQTLELAERLTPERQVILVGRTEEKEPALPAGCISYLNRTTIDGLIWLIRRAAFVVSVDSGPMHLAAALDRPLLSIHAWTDPRKVGPYRPDAWVWKNGKLFRFAQRHEWDNRFYDLQRLALRTVDLDMIAAVAAGETAITG